MNTPATMYPEVALETDASSSRSLAGRFMWLPRKSKTGELSGARLPRDKAYNHPVVVRSSEPNANGDVVVYIVTSLKGESLGACHLKSKSFAWRAQYLPVEPSEPHPDNGMRLYLERQSKPLTKASYINVANPCVLPLRILRKYNRHQRERTPYDYVLRRDSFEALFRYCDTHFHSSHHMLPRQLQSFDIPRVSVGSSRAMVQQKHIGQPTSPVAAHRTWERSVPYASLYQPPLVDRAISQARVLYQSTPDTHITPRAARSYGTTAPTNHVSPGTWFRGLTWRRERRYAQYSGGMLHTGGDRRGERSWLALVAKILIWLAVLAGFVYGIHWAVMGLVALFHAAIALIVTTWEECITSIVTTWEECITSIVTTWEECITSIVSTWEEWLDALRRLWQEFWLSVR